MAFCSNCGAQLEDGANACPNCGTAVGANPEVNAAQSTSGADDVNQNKVYAILAYFGILVLIPILAAPKSEFAKFHSNQGLLLLIGALICMVIGVIPFVGWLIAFAGDIFILVLAIMGIINAAKGEMKELPLIGSIKILK